MTIAWSCEKWQAISWPVGHFDPPPASLRVKIFISFNVFWLQTCLKQCQFISSMQRTCSSIFFMLPIECSSKKQNMLQCNLDLVKSNLVTTCDLVTIFQRKFLNLLYNFIQLMTLCNLLTVFAESKSVNKSRLHCSLKFYNIGYIASNFQLSFNMMCHVCNLCNVLRAMV